MVLLLGSQLGPSLANFFPAYLENRHICNSVFTRNFYNTYIDDICVIFTDSDNIEPFLDFIIDLQPNLMVTIEYATDTYPFLKC